jgi:hypothetical protein
LAQARSVLDTTTLTVDRRRLDQLADGALRYSADTGDLQWARWALGLYSKRGIAPGPEVGQQLSSLPPETRGGLIQEVSAVVRSLRPAREGAEAPDDATIRVLRSLAAGGASEAG